MKRFFKQETGEFTVEASIVFVAAFMVLIVFFYIGMIMYQHVHLQSITDRIASRGAVMYATRTTDMVGGQQVPDFYNADPYRYFFDGSYKNRAQSAIQSALSNAVLFGNITQDGGDSRPTANVVLSLFNRRVEVKGERHYTVPFVPDFGLDNSLFDINVKSTSMIIDMPEMIRNIDLVRDLLNRNPQVATVIEKLGTYKTKLLEFIQKIE